MVKWIVNFLTWYTYKPEMFVSLKLSTHRRRRRDSAVELSRVGGVYGIRNQLSTVSTNLNKFGNSEVELRCRQCERTRRQSS